MNHSRTTRNRPVRMATEQAKGGRMGSTGLGWFEGQPESRPNDCRSNGPLRIPEAKAPDPGDPQ